MDHIAKTSHSERVEIPDGQQALDLALAAINADITFLKQNYEGVTYTAALSQITGRVLYELMLACGNTESFANALNLLIMNANKDALKDPDDPGGQLKVIHTPHEKPPATLM